MNHKIADLVSQIDVYLTHVPFTRKGGSLLTLTGLPGTGKSLLANSLQTLANSVIIRSDAIRRFMTANPTFSDEENQMVYEIGYCLIKQRLQKGQRVIFDATNLHRENRDAVLRVGREVGAVVTFCHLVVDEEVARDRLDRRHSGERRLGDLSNANWEVYQLLQHSYEPVTEPHLELDSTDKGAIQLAEEVLEYWEQEEAALEEEVDEWGMATANETVAFSF